MKPCNDCEQIVRNAKTEFFFIGAIVGLVFGVVWAKSVQISLEQDDRGAVYYDSSDKYYR